MELIPFLIFAVIAFNIFKGFTKAGNSKAKNSRHEALQSLRAQIQEAAQAQDAGQKRYKAKSPTQRGRESLARKDQSSPWGDDGGVAPGARVAANYLQKTKKARKASHKSPVQHGRRGKNMDQNRHRTDGWGQRGDSGILSAKAVIIFLIIGAGILYVLSHMPAS